MFFSKNFNPKNVFGKILDEKAKSEPKTNPNQKFGALTKSKCKCTRSSGRVSIGALLASPEK